MATHPKRAIFDKSKTHVDFLGYSVSADKVSIKAEAVRRIKKQLVYLLYRNLIQPYMTLPVRGQIIPRNGSDASFITAMMEVRRYLYGGLNEIVLKKYLRGEMTRIQFKGLMSYYPLVNDEEQLANIDRWLVCTILETLKKREKLLKLRSLIKADYSDFPFNMNHLNVIKESRKHIHKGN